jgi:hypothetical protein
MDGSPSSITMLGLGNGTFAGSPSLVLTLGLGVGEASAVTLVGTWSNVINCRSENQRIDCQSSNQRIDT